MPVWYARCIYCYFVVDSRCMFRLNNTLSLIQRWLLADIMKCIYMSKNGGSEDGCLWARGNLNRRVDTRGKVSLAAPLLS